MNKGKIFVKNDYPKKIIFVQLSELLYLCFWGLMLFAKGIGLYDGQPLYKLFLVAAFLCIAVKMCIVEYSPRELLVILLLMVWSAVVYLISGEKGVLICTVTVVTMKNVSVKKAFQVGLIVWLTAMGGRFLLSLMYIDGVETAVQTKNITGAVLRYFMGYPHPNVLHISYLTLVALTIYCAKQIYNWKHFWILTVGNIFLFFYTYSFTGAGIVTLYLCLSLYVKKRRIGKTEYFIAKMLFPFCVLFSIVLPSVLRGKAFEFADKVFNNRINFAKHFLTIDNLSLLGNNLAEITTDIITMDNSYIFVLVIYGLPVFILMCIGYMCIILSYIRQKKNMELVMICCFLVAGITEPFLFNTSFKNLTLLFVGEFFCMVLSENNKDEKRVSVLKNRDKNIDISIIWIWNIGKQIRYLWKIHKRMTIGCGVVLAFMISIGCGVLYQARESVLEVQKDNLLFFERVRVMITVFSLSFIVIGIAINIWYWITEKESHRRN